MENMNDNRLSDHEVEINLLTDGERETPQRKHQGCLSFLQRAWGKLTETKNLDHDLDSLELYYLRELIVYNRLLLFFRAK
ncbi:hypothetical protein WA026_007392 [Henosepilachna vigintioctopunctata]|uniref:Uncharacterized protein n=1 Tax=Henosepilachna vigintioctopunctata TaxID=420089 RepID=A0AAW1UY92_9CUCU